MMPKLIQHDNIDRAPQGPQHIDSAPWQRERRWIPDWRSLAVLCAFALLLLLIGYWLFGRDVRAWVQYGGGDWIVLWPIRIGIGALILAVVRRAVLVNQRGYQVPIWQASALVPKLIPVDTAYANRLFPVAAQVTNTTVPPMLPEPDIIDAEVMPEEVLPDIGPLAIEDWMRRLNNEPHAIFAAKTKGGKSTMAKVGLQPRISAGESVFIIDPHSNGWLDLPGVGGGLNWSEVEDAMSTVMALYKSRMQEREYHQRHTGHELSQRHFPRLTVIFDEANESRTEITKRHATKGNPWPAFTDCMGSGSRKVGISLWLICQSALIKNLGGSTVMRRNFTVFALDHMTIRELIEEEEPIKQRRELIVSRLGGTRFPAATVIDGQAFLLDRTDIDQVEPSSARGCAWDGWDYDKRCGIFLPVKPVVNAAAQAASAVSTSVPTPDPLAQYNKMKFVDDEARIGWLAYYTKLGTREIREIVGCHYPTVVAVAGKVRATKRQRGL